MSDLVLDASLTLQWFLEDETERQYSLGVLAALADRTALVPRIWFYEVGNGLLMASRRQRIASGQIKGFLSRLRVLPIAAAEEEPSAVFELPALAGAHGLTNYDAAYLALAIRSGLPLATSDRGLRKAATASGIEIFAPPGASATHGSLPSR